MTGLVKTVNKEIEKIGKTTCLVKNIKDDGCVIYLTKAPRMRLIADVNKLCPSPKEGQKRCDYLIVTETQKARWVVLLELKSGKVRGSEASKAIEQLRAGTRVAEKIVPDQKEIKFCPMLAYGSMHHYGIRKLRSIKIGFYGRPGESIKWVKCGTVLAEVLKM